MTTNLMPCSTNSANFYVAGMYPSTQYLMHWEEYAGTTLVNTGSRSAVHYRRASLHLPDQYFHGQCAAHRHTTRPIQWSCFRRRYPNRDRPRREGDLVFPQPLRNYSLLGWSPAAISIRSATELLEQYDLAGNMVLQTNLEIINEQLAAKGYPTITAFNSHEARNLPNGNIGLLGTRDVTSTSAQGGTPTNPVDIIGDMVLVLDHNLQLVWAWDSFAHEDINRAATYGETARMDGRMPAFNPSFTIGNDWLHTNALQGTADGNIIISQRAQDMVLKINYANGTGDGSVIWRMGAGLDFTIVNPPQPELQPPSPATPTSFPWFTHQHDAHFEFEEDAGGGGFMIMTVFDDGNTRLRRVPRDSKQPRHGSPGR